MMLAHGMTEDNAVASIVVVVEQSNQAVLQLAPAAVGVSKAGAGACSGLQRVVPQVGGQIHAVQPSIYNVVPVTLH
jgi:hypothetical protein